MLRKIKSILGKQDVIKPIVDMRNYGTNTSSYTGNSLSDSNVLFVSNIKLANKDVNVIEGIMQKENCNYTIFEYEEDRVLDTLNIREVAKSLIGPFDHVINLFYVNQNINEDFVEDFYKNIKVETEYLINSVKYGTVCTAIIYNSNIEIEKKASLHGMKSLIAGLGIVLPNHGLISNGVLADDRIPIASIINTVLFLSSKFGQILTGEVFEMKL